jgi:signal peptidase I
MSEPDFLEPSSDLEPQPEAARPSTPWWRELIETFLPAVAIVLAINLFLAQPRVVHGQSMEPNLHENQRVIVDLVTYHFRAPQRGEIIVLDLPDRKAEPPLIKRVVGLPGEIVEIKGGAVLVNGQKLDEPYLNQLTLGNMPAQVVPEAHVFVLGDNRGSSNDSRYFGVVPFGDILGRAWLRYWPPSDVSLFR